MVRSVCKLSQYTLGVIKIIPEHLDDYVVEDNIVRIVDPALVPATRVLRIKEKIAGLKEQIESLGELDKQLKQAPDQQISLTDPDARSMSTSGRGTATVGYNVQSAVDTNHHLIVAHEVTNIGNDRAQLASMAKQANEVLGKEHLEVNADRGYYSGPEILACEESGMVPLVPNPPLYLYQYYWASNSTSEALGHPPLGSSAAGSCISDIKKRQLIK